MLRITKLTDYAFILLSHMAQRPEHPFNSAAAARLTGLPHPSVSKILKSLARAGIVTSVRGARGGYRLAGSAEKLSVADVIGAVEGPISLTACSGDDADTCEYSGCCALETNWSRINRTIREALGSISLVELSRPSSPRLVVLRRKSAQQAIALPEPTH